MDTPEKPRETDELASDTGRRSFLVGTLLTASGAVISLGLAVPLVRFSTFPLHQDAAEAEWSDVGPVDEFTALKGPVAKTITVVKKDAWQTTSAQTAVYVLPTQAGDFRILSPVCPHLGCSVRWVDTQSQFICPCHNGTFTAQGEYVSGPPRRSMDTLETKVVDGVLKVRYKYFRQLIATKEEVA